MKRSPLRRSAAPKLQRQPIPAVNHKRRLRLYELQFGEAAQRVRDLPCCVCFAPPPSDPHHVKTRGAGGTSADLVPLCRGHHDMVGCWGVKTFIRESGVDLYAVAAKIAAELAV